MSTEVQTLARNWVLKAENDLKIGQDELQTEEPATDMVCFHMQQCVEKYLKAFLTLHRTVFRRTHDIAELIEGCKAIAPDFERLYDLHADHLTMYGVEIRYPDDFYLPTREEAEHCATTALAVREFVRERLKQAGLDLV